jgi:hypothetical protein
MTICEFLTPAQKALADAMQRQISAAVAQRDPDAIARIEDAVRKASAEIKRGAA